MLYTQIYIKFINDLFVLKHNYQSGYAIWC